MQPPKPISQAVQSSHLDNLQARAADKSDLDSWQPTCCGDIDMQFRRDGSWWYLGTPILRPELVKLFARVLRREGDEYFLVTPVEKVRITVEDAPFLITECEVLDDVITFTSNIGDRFALDAEHALQIRGDAEHPRPYVHVRKQLYALLSRPVYYQLCEMARADVIDPSRIGVVSAGQFFVLTL